MIEFNKLRKNNKIRLFCPLLISILILFISTKLSAQVYSNGITNISGNNVGIGTSVPTSKLSLWIDPTTPSGTPHLKFTLATIGGPPSFTTTTYDWSFVGTGNELKFLYNNSIGYSLTQLFGINKDFVKVYAPSFIVNTDFKIDLAGNVGIGTLTPDSKLHLATGMFHIGTGSIKIDNGNINIGSAPIISGTSIQVQSGDVKLLSGKLIIGSVPSTPSGYSLYAKNGILTERVKVAIASTADWSDFVFDSKYKLLPLPQLSNYIKLHNHLPAVPSAGEMVTEGLDLGKMDATLLQKIEELTLYTIQLYQSNESLQKRIEELQLQIDNLKH